MDNTQSSELKTEILMRVLIGDEVSVATLTVLLQMGLIRKRKGMEKKVGIDVWLFGPTTDFELTEKGLRRLDGQ